METSFGSGSMPDGENTTTNLYVSNLAPDLNEDILKREFGRFGPVASVKIMWPRDEDQIKRGSNVGFVAFLVKTSPSVVRRVPTRTFVVQERDSAAKCIEKLNGEKLHGLELRIGWGKSVPLINSAPTSRHHGSKTAPPAPEQAISARSDVAEKDIEVAIPEDLHVRYVIDAMAAFVAKDGPKFEQLVRQRESINPAFAFLFENGSAGNIYYRWKLFTLVQGDTMRRWRLDPFQMVDGGPSWNPPNMCMGDGSQLTAAQRGEGIGKRSLLSEIERHKFEKMLQNLRSDRKSICEAMVFSLNNAEAAEEVVEILVEALCQETSVTLKIGHLFVVSDILHNSSASVRNASQYRTRLQERLPDVFENFQAVHATLHDKKDTQEAVKKSSPPPTLFCLNDIWLGRYVLRVLRVWRNWFIFSNDYLNGLQSTFLATLRSQEQLVETLKKVEKMSVEEIERRCKFNGLSLRGGIVQQRLRCARLDAYLQAVPPSSMPSPKKAKSTKPKRQHLSFQKRDVARLSPAEKKTSAWVSVGKEQEAKPVVPVSQWIQDKQQTPSEGHVMAAVDKPVPVKAAKNEDIDMFEADDDGSEARHTDAMDIESVSWKKKKKKRKTES